MELIDSIWFEMFINKCIICGVVPYLEAIAMNNVTNVTKLPKFNLHKKIGNTFSLKGYKFLSLAVKVTYMRYVKRIAYMID